MTPAATPMIPLFVYGTLRQGCGLHPRIARAILPNTHIIRAVARDHRLYSGPGFPFMVHEEGARTVGDLMIVDTGSPDFQSVTDMEVAVGYDFHRIEVEFDSFDGVCTEFAAAYVWPSADSHSIGSPIPGGDWVEYQQALRKTSVSL